MLYLVKATFVPDAEARRDAAHEAFGDHLAQRHPRIRLGAALRDGDGRRSGVMLILEANDLAEIEALLADSPYTKAGIYRSVEIDQVDLEIGSLG